MPKPSHSKAEPEAQEEFKKNFSQLVEQLASSRDANDSRPILILAADEGKFDRTGEIRRCWCPLGIRPVVPKQQVREYIYAYTAVAPELGKMARFKNR